MSALEFSSKRLVLAIVMAIVAAILATPSVAYADVYKCIGSNGELQFQAVPCASGATQSKVEIEPAPEVPTPVPTDHPPTSQTSKASAEVKQAGTNSSQDRSREFAAERCKTATRAYRAEAARVVNSCKQARNTYCDQSPEEIERLNDGQWLRGASDQQVRNYERTNAQGTKLQRLKRDVDTNCRS